MLAGFEVALETRAEVGVDLVIDIVGQASRQLISTTSIGPILPVS